MLRQGSFGPTAADIAHVQAVGAPAWLGEQLALPPTLHRHAFETLAGSPNNYYFQPIRYSVWWDAALHAPDQLRQRVAFALSEIFVISDRDDGLFHTEQGVSGYYDILVKDAFGNFRQLLEDVTLSPQMGVYLSMLGNAKGDPAKGTHADENYAREVMQLFTIGLVQLNPDGTPKLDSASQPVPTYSQGDIENLARVFTGWDWPGAPAFGRGKRNWDGPMQPFDSAHDTSAKTIVNGTSVPAGGSVRGDLKIALDTLFNHPNVGPFIAERLIQRLVTSNPSPAYVGRVAAVFSDNGSGVRGDLGAVVSAILLDPEARDLAARPAGFGKQREPLVALSHLWRVYDARAASGHYLYSPEEPALAHPSGLMDDLGEAPLSGPSVFNFFSPFYAPLGAIAQQSLVAPEFQIEDSSSLNRLANTLYRFASVQQLGMPAAAGDILVDYSAEQAVACDPVQLIDHLNLNLMSGQMSDGMGTALLKYLNNPALGPQQRVSDAVYLTMTSPQFWTEQ